MATGDVAQQSGHEGGEMMGRGGARVSAAAVAAEGSACCVCMEPWTCSGAHRICCIPCGHVYGRSCLESWLSRSRSISAKCPQCCKRFTLGHIVNLYVSGGNLLDGCTCTHCQAPVTSEPSISETDLFKQVLDILLEPANIEKEHGVHFDEIVKRFKLPERKIMDALCFHIDMGTIYTTIDDHHYMALEGFQAGLPVHLQQTYYQQRVLTNQAPVTSGPSGSETDLFSQVLDILHEPVNSEKEHGMHFNEIVQRLKLPERNIMDAIRYHVDAGNIYYTIDDFHFKSAVFC